MDEAILAHTATAPRRRDTLKIAIVGAGFGGIGLAILLRQAGFTQITIFERAAKLGGTWRDNAYPGAACDVPSHLYCYSFAPNPHWSARYASQAEILAYLNDTAERFGVKSSIRLGTPVVAAAWREESATWLVETPDGTEEFDIFVTAAGQLSQPGLPDFPGLATFVGHVFHSARWNPAANLNGARVALIGAAASAIQIAPQLAPHVEHLTIFQRTPNWIIPRFQGQYGARRRTLFANIPGARRAFRYALWQYQELLFGAFRTFSRRNRLLRALARWHLRRQVNDPALREQLTPNYELGCKRLLVSDDYLPIFNRPNVSLVTTPIEAFTPEGIRTTDGTLHQARAAIFATGFDVANVLAPIRITGRNGLDLQQHWAAGPEAYRGVAVPGFPNLFLLYGPNTNLGHSSIILMLEAQSRYIRTCLEHLAARNLAALEVSQAANSAYNRQLQQDLAGTVWNTGCGNWYTAAGRITANWSGSTLDYIRVMRRVTITDFLQHTGRPGALPLDPAGPEARTPSI